ncbi:MAG: peptide deformylase [Helicobacteraceae bacterium]|nr:peptide deformylase [Helicobacteraceae bacterium]
MILDIVKYPDNRLKIKSKNVELFDESLHTHLDNMYETMLRFNGIGLASVQVAKPIRLFIINLPMNDDDEEQTQSKNDLVEFINPVIKSSEGTTMYQEGCLSVPEFYEDVERHEAIVITFQNRDAEEQTLECDGLLAIAIQHELDHLEGKLFIDKLSYIRRKKFEKEYKRAQKEKAKKN